MRKSLSGILKNSEEHVNQIKSPQKQQTLTQPSASLLFALGNCAIAYKVSVTHLGFILFFC